LSGRKTSDARTLLRNGPPRSNARTLSSVVVAMLSSASRVKKPWWAVSSTFGNVSSRASTSSCSTRSGRAQKGRILLFSGPPGVGNQALQNARDGQHIAYFVFDLLALDDDDLTPLPLE
jgi:hypothetical protein